MKRLLISGFVAVALLAVATTLRSHSIISADRSDRDHRRGVVEEISGRRGRNQASDRRVRGYVAGLFDADEAVIEAG